MYADGNKYNYQKKCIYRYIYLFFLNTLSRFLSWKTELTQTGKDMERTLDSLGDQGLERQ